MVVIFPLRLAFFSGLGNIIRKNQTEWGHCNGCRYLMKTRLPKRFISSYFSSISLHDFCGCNSNCVYCKGSEYFLPEKYIASFDHEILFRNLLKEELIKTNRTNISWGGGEPTLLNTFEKTVDFLLSKRIRQTINTSGIKYSPAIEKVLKEQFAMVRISVDSGTDETYVKVKGNSNSELVWKSIKRYAETKGDLIVKYIVFPLNSDANEIEKFVDRCYNFGVKKICISTDMRSAFTVNSEQPKISFKELVAAALIYNLCIPKKINTQFESIWLPEHIEKIKLISNFHESIKNKVSRRMDILLKIIKGKDSFKRLYKLYRNDVVINRKSKAS